MEGDENVEVGAAGDEQVLPPPVGAPAAGVEGDDALLGAGDAADPLPPPPPPPPAPAAVEDEVEEERVVVPAAAPWYKDRVNVGLIVLTFAILVFIFVYDMGVHPTAWWGKLAAMTGVQWRAAFFLAVGDIASLGLVFSQSGYFRRVWAEGGAGLAAVVPPLAGAINCLVWLVYGVVVDGKNISVIVVNGTGVVFNLMYTFIFFRRSGTPRKYTLAVICVAVAVATAIAAIDYVLIHTWGWKLPQAVGGSGAITGLLMYVFGGCVAMKAACHNRGADGLPAQAVASFVNALVWFIYACVQGDLSMQIPNGVRIAFFLLQAAQLVFFHFKPRKEEADGIRARLLPEET